MNFLKKLLFSAWQVNSGPLIIKISLLAVMRWVHVVPKLFIKSSIELNS